MFSMEKLKYVDPERVRAMFSRALQPDVDGLTCDFLQDDNFYYERKELTCIKPGWKDNTLAELFQKIPEPMKGYICPRDWIRDFRFGRNREGMVVISPSRKYRKTFPSGKAFVNDVRSALMELPCYQGNHPSSLRDLVNMIVNHWENLSSLENDIEMNIHEQVDHELKCHMDSDRYYTTEEGYQDRQDRIEERLAKIPGFKILTSVTENLPSLAIRLIYEYTESLKSLA